MALVGHKHNLVKRQARAQLGVGNNSACGTGVLAVLGAKRPCQDGPAAKQEPNRVIIRFCCRLTVENGL